MHLRCSRIPTEDDIGFMAWPSLPGSGWLDADEDLPRVSTEPIDDKIEVSVVFRLPRGRRGTVAQLLRFGTEVANLLGSALMNKKKMTIWRTIS